MENYSYRGGLRAIHISFIFGDWGRSARADINGFYMEDGGWEGEKKVAIAELELFVLLQVCGGWDRVTRLHYYWHYNMQHTHGRLGGFNGMVGNYRAFNRWICVCGGGGFCWGSWWP